MDKDNKVLLAAVLIIVVALVAFNFGDLTGAATRDSTIIVVSPASVSFGEYDTAKVVSIRVIPGKSGVDAKMELYREGGSRMAGETVNICMQSTCYDETTLTYTVSASLESGLYFFQAEKAKIGAKYKSNLFEVK